LESNQFDGAMFVVPNLSHPSFAPPWPDPPLRTSKVIIAGFATETMLQAPYDDPSFEVWGLNMIHAHLPRWDRLWELHDMATLEQETEALKRSTNHLGVLRAERTRPIYMVEAHESIPMSRRFPVETMTAYCSGLCEKLARAPYYTSTFAFMLATAVMGIVNRRENPHVPEAGETIWVAGVELLNGEEYAYQRSCAEFWCGFVLGHGIQLVIPDRSALLESDGLYGYARAESLELLARMRAYYEDMRDKTREKRDAAALRREQAKADWNSYDGAMQGIDRVLNHITYLCRGGKV
jgi:hypothetical protein